MSLGPTVRATPEMLQLAPPTAAAQDPAFRRYSTMAMPSFSGSSAVPETLIWVVAFETTMSVAGAPIVTTGASLLPSRVTRRLTIGLYFSSLSRARTSTRLTPTASP